MTVTELVEYQEGSIVSRVLLKGDGGSVTFFAFARDESLSEHTTPFDAVVTVLDGEAAVTIGGTEHRVAAGAAIVMPAGVPHALSAPQPFKMMLTMIRSPHTEA